MSFAEFFAGVHGYSPYPWQIAAAQRLAEDTEFAQVSVPTGCGKTAMIDAAIYHAAHGGPHRIFFIINRRVVVDEAAERAKAIATTLEAATEPTLSKMADRLGPIRVVRLRGGVHVEDEWVWHPEQTTIVLSTIDQVGSRLLHRGYGVSSRMWPLHAGFVGNDALYLLDEAHISAPFASTVRSTIEHGASIRLIQMSATLKDQSGSAVELSGNDLKNPRLKKVLKARKLAQLVKTQDSDQHFVAQAVESAKGLSASGAVIAVVVNQVRTARGIWEKLSKDGHRAELLIGRIRPWDRDRLMERLMPLVKAGRARAEGEPLFIAATQTVEVGADFDFDALVTEAAPLSALRQRFGRLDRRGELENTRAFILGREKQLCEDSSHNAPVYGTDISTTWLWLESLDASKGNTDFGLSAFEQSIDEMGLPLEAEPHCPQLLPPIIESFSQTGTDAPFFDPSPWLHGPQRRSTDVSVVWRADLKEAHTGEWVERVRAFPPATREALQIPMGALRALLDQSAGEAVSDIEGAETGYAEKEDKAHKPILRWRGVDESAVITRWELRPGDTVVLPAPYGGCDAYGWNPNCQKPVEDIAEQCALEGFNRFRLRLVTGLMNWVGGEKPALLAAISELRAANLEEDPELGVDENRIATAWGNLQAILTTIDHPYTRALGDSYEYSLLPNEGLILAQRQLEEYEGGANTGMQILLDDHLSGVKDMVSNLATGNPHAESLIDAAVQHDLGKQAEAFQAMLHGDPIKAAAGPLLAKSGIRTRTALIQSWRRSGLPAHFRHELHSLTLSYPEDMLTAYLIGTHHGFGRPWFPRCGDMTAPGTQWIDLKARWAGKFATLINELGPWGLAELELILRSCDIRQSQAEQG